MALETLEMATSTKPDVSVAPFVLSTILDMDIMAITDDNTDRPVLCVDLPVDFSGIALVAVAPSVLTIDLDTLDNNTSPAVVRTP